MDLINCIVDGNHGIYVPQAFAEFVDPETLEGVSQEDIGVLLSGPDNEEYWEAWDNVINNAVITIDGVEHRLYQEGDLFMYREPLNNNEREELNALYEGDVYELNENENED